VSDFAGLIEFEEASVGVGVNESPTVSSTLSGNLVSGTVPNANSGTPPSSGAPEGADLKNGAEGKHWKREGNAEAGQGSGQQPGQPTPAAGGQQQSKPSRRTTSLLNLFMSNSQGMF